MQTDDSQLTMAKPSVLTPAEQSVLDQALTGVPARDIAEHLSLSEATVRSHLSSIYVKLGVSGRVASPSGGSSLECRSRPSWSWERSPSRLAGSPSGRWMPIRLLRAREAEAPKGALMDPVSCVSYVSWVYSVNAAKTHEAVW